MVIGRPIVRGDEVEAIVRGKPCRKCTGALWSFFGRPSLDDGLGLSNGALTYRPLDLVPGLVPPVCSVRPF